MAHPNSFELFGFDLILDTNLKVWLLEVNSSPSLAVENPLDELIKTQVVQDTLRIAEPLQN